MDYLPQDPFMLVSSINMLLRDGEFDTLESLCCNFNKEPEEIKSYLHALALSIVSSSGSSDPLDTTNNNKG